MSIENVRVMRLPSGFAEKLMFIAIALLPFQQAFTIPIGFPLKVSEFLGLLSVILFVIERRPPSFIFTGKILFWGILFLVLASTTLWLFAGPPAPESEGYVRGLNQDMLLYAAYACVAMALAWFAGTRLGFYWIARGFSIAIKLTAIYVFIQVLLFSLGVDSILHGFQGTTQLGTTFGFEIPRNGPFLEGNYLGFFAGAALLISLQHKDRVALSVATVCLIYSQSTIALGALVIAGLFALLSRPSNRSVAVFTSIGIVLILVVNFIPTAQIFFLSQLGKLGLNDIAYVGSDLNRSLLVRTETTLRGFEIASAFPWLGVGPGRYGYWDDFFAVDVFIGGRGIANNAYAQLASEVGMIALFLFLCFLLYLAIQVFRRNRLKLALVVFLFVALAGSPSWTALPIWFSISFLASETMKPQVRKLVATIGLQQKPAANTNQKSDENFRFEVGAASSLLQ